VIGSWVVHGQPAGICVREDICSTTNNDSCFVPHVVNRRQGSDRIYIRIDHKEAATNGRLQSYAEQEFSGYYERIGLMRNAPLYWSDERKLFLSMSTRGCWMLTDRPDGGTSGDSCLAIMRNPHSGPSGGCTIANFSRPQWLVYDHSKEEFVPVSNMRSEQTAQPVDFTPEHRLNFEQENLRYELYRATTAQAASTGEQRTQSSTEIGQPNSSGSSASSAGSAHRSGVSPWWWWGSSNSTSKSSNSTARPANPSPDKPNASSPSPPPPRKPVAKWYTRSNVKDEPGRAKPGDAQKHTDSRMAQTKRHAASGGSSGRKATGSYGHSLGSSGRS